MISNRVSQKRSKAELSKEADTTEHFIVITFGTEKLAEPIIDKTPIDKPYFIGVPSSNPFLKWINEGIQKHIATTNLNNKLQGLTPSTSRTGHGRTGSQRRFRPLSTQISQVCIRCLCPILGPRRKTKMCELCTAKMIHVSNFASLYFYSN